jgi:hypothetical protein
MVKKILLGILVLLLAIVGYYWYMFSRKRGGDDGPKQPPLVLKQHSGAFNNSITNVLNAYFDMKAAFVDADSAKAKEDCKRMILLTDSIDLTELKKDTTGIFLTDSISLENIRSNAKSLLLQPNITEMRKDFSMVNENLYPFLKAINYQGPKMYWQNCPMAFGEGKEANWISNTEEIVNPYLGKNNPEFKSAMLHCGEIKDTIKAQ